ncbi:glycosyltransferase family 2 protein [Heyndrickxia acidiproducens]|uniref:glycosyltransferase family 2 protein n=1 Tax=Heyndrickxia acidiproducens TaxID=1121084 RepID=UPI00036CF6D6|nr:glycosyltransferase family 2 protein [Heyndrickxia acidiproducens]
MKISVIIPVYNVEAYLDECLDSLINQTYPVYEIIAVDDGSKDRSCKILAKWTKRLPQLRIIRQKHSGAPGGPRNKGLALAGGDYIHFLDPDDYIDPNFYESSMAYIKQHHPDMLITKILKCNTRKKWEIQLFKTLGIFKENRLTHLFESNNLIHNLGPANKIFKREFLMQNRLQFLERRRFEDVHFVTCCLYLAKKVYINCQTHYYWRKRESLRNLSITQKNFMFKAVRDRVFIHQEIDRFLMEHGLLGHRYIKDIRAVLDFNRYASNLYRFLPPYQRRFFTLANEYLETIDERAFTYLPNRELELTRHFFLRNHLDFEFVATATADHGYLPVTVDENGTQHFDFRHLKGKFRFDHLLPATIPVPKHLMPEKAELLEADYCLRSLSLKGVGQIGYFPPKSKEDAAMTIILQNRATKEERFCPAVTHLSVDRQMTFVAVVDAQLLKDWLNQQQTVDLFLQIKVHHLSKKIRLHTVPHVKLGNYALNGELSVTTYGNLSIVPMTVEQHAKGLSRKWRTGLKLGRRRA